VDDLFALVEHSLVEATADDGGEPRFGLLETLREHALERLEASGEAHAVRRRHAEAFLRLAEEAEPFLVSAERVPTSGTNPIFPKPGTINACSAAIAISQDSANAKPTPAAGPLSAAMNALSVCPISRTMAPN
jgi:hypothetical protein